MKRLSRAIAFIVVGGVVTAGCNTILGNEPGILDPFFAGIPEGGDENTEAGENDAANDQATGDVADSALQPSTIGTVGQPCTPGGALGCAGNAQRKKLLCKVDKWESNDTCKVGEACNTAAGAMAGTCNPIVSQCKGMTPGDIVCQDRARVECGPDLVTVKAIETCPFVCTSTKCEGACAVNTDRCFQNNVQKCQASGQWATTQACTDQACVSNACTGVCEPGGTRCAGNGVETCDANGAYGAAAPCVNQGCVGGACTGVCAPNATRCNAGGNGVETCSSSGQWGAAVACGSICMAGACAGDCVPTTKQCSGNGVQTCDGGGQWGAPVACVNQACVAGACVGECTPNAKQCMSNGVQTCSSMGMWSAPVTCVDQACVSGGCTGVCTPGTTQCSGNGVQTCSATGQWGNPATCVDQACVAGACTGVCTPNNKRCATNTTTETCSSMGVWQASGTCNNDDVCSTATGTCVACTPIGTACTTNDNCCSGFCDNLVCRAPNTFCGQTGNKCTNADDCCGGFCDGNPKVCRSSTVGGTANCLAAGTYSATATCNISCCSRSGEPWSSAGQKICQRPSGCGSGGEICRAASDCCATQGCLKVGAETVGKCSNGGPCMAAGQVCKTMAITQCGSNGCCEATGQPGGESCGTHPDNCCRQDALGIPRCVIAYRNCAASGAPPATTACATSADCCGNPCVNKMCLAPGACASQGQACSSTSDCCAGLPCNVLPGSASGTCGTSIAACSLPGQPCTVSANCCNGVACNANNRCGSL